MQLLQFTLLSKNKNKSQHPSSPVSQRRSLHSGSTIKSSWVLRLSETKVLKFSTPPMVILFSYFLSLSQTDSGRLGPPSHMVINCLILRLRFPGDLDLSCKELRQHLELVLQSFMFGSCFWTRREGVRAWGGVHTTCVPVLLAIIHCDTLDTSNEQLGRRVGAEAGSQS